MTGALREWTRPGRWPLWTALLLVGLFAFQRISDMDAGWLLSLGREVARGHIPATNALAWTARDTPWYPTNWLFDLGLYGAFRALGVFGVQLTVLAGGAAALLFAHRAARRAGAGLAAADAAVLLAVGVFWTRLTPRPHLIEYLFEAIILERCFAARAARRFGPLLAVPPLLAVWANCHQSAPFGLAVAGLCMADAVLWKREGWDPRQRAGLAVVLFASAVALVATPGLDANLRDLAAHLHIGERLPILEHQRPTLSADPAIFALGAAVLLCAWLTRDRAWASAPALLFAAMTFGLGRRFGGDLALLGAVPVALAATGARFDGTRARRGALGLASLGSALLLLRLGQVPLLSLGVLAGFEWDPFALPVEAAQAARAAGLGPRGFQAFRFGGYVGFVNPEEPQFQDGRVRAWPPAFWTNEIAAMQSPAAFAAWLDRWGVTWALVSATPAPLSGYGLLDRAPQWKRIHADDTAEVWVRR
jgi:hypothetical protein